MFNHSWAQVPPNYIVEKEKNSHMSVYVNRDSTQKWWLITLKIELYHHVNGTNIITHMKLIPSRRHMWLVDTIFLGLDG